MNCDLARQLLLFQRPGELSAEDAELVTRHVAGCPGCAAFVLAEGRFDGALSAAMPSVPVPGGGRAKAFEAVRAYRAAALRRSARHVLHVAATLFVAAGLTLGAANRLRPTFDAYGVAATNEATMTDPKARAAEWLAAEGCPAELPVDLDFRHHLGHGSERVQGRPVPVLTFAIRSPNGDALAYAKVYVVRRGQFHLDAVRDAQNSSCTATAYRDPRHPEVAWLVVHTTPDLKPFLRQPDGELVSLR